jgi:hypothetical protein
MQQMIIQLPYLQQRNFLRKSWKQYVKEGEASLVNTHLESRKELKFSIIKMKDTWLKIVR